MIKNKNKNNLSKKKTILTWGSIFVMLLLLLCNSIPSYASEGDFSEFPESYRAGLRELHEMHPNWSFEVFDTGLDWNTVILNEIYSKGNPELGLSGRSAIGKNVSEEWKFKEEEGNFKLLDNSGNWYLASEEAVSYYLNPVNYFDEKHIFVFEQLSYNETNHTLEGIEGMLKGTWMEGIPLEDGSSGDFTYAQVILQAAMETGVSPYHLAGRIIQEQGTKGTGVLISGNVDEYVKYEVDSHFEIPVYNYYNIGASGNAIKIVISSGLRYATNNSWMSRYTAIIGGAAFIGKSYINRGQDNLYLQKFDVDNSDNSLYVHQYMQNIQAPYSESVSAYKAYVNAEALEQNFVFKIPVYKNMPDEKPPIDDEKVDAFVTRLYDVCLNRIPDEDGKKTWKDLLINREKSGAETAYGFIFSDEFKNRNYCNECYVKQLYKAFMGRDYDEDGLKGWVKLLDEGTTREEVFYGFALSDEFKGLCDECGIEPGEKGEIPKIGTIPLGNCTNCDKEVDLSGVTQFVIRLYNICLERDPDSEGLNKHCNSLQTRECTGRQVAFNFVFSDEFKSNEYSDEVYVEYLYRILLNREADESGKADWVELLQNQKSREDLFQQFGASKEFVEICEGYGISN